MFGFFIRRGVRRGFEDREGRLLGGRSGYHLVEGNLEADAGVSVRNSAGDVIARDVWVRFC